MGECPAPPSTWVEGMHHLLSPELQSWSGLYSPGAQGEEWKPWRDGIQG